MPELPEVETVRQGLADWVIGRPITAVGVLHPRAIRRHLPGAAHFEAALLGRTITGVRRRGKYLWLPLDDGDAILAHLGMSGQFLLREEGAPDETHLRVRGELRRRPQMRFRRPADVRRPVAEPGRRRAAAEIAHIARDPMDELFDDAAFQHGAAPAAHRGEARAARPVADSGVGNIYADGPCGGRGCTVPARPTS